MRERMLRVALDPFLLKHPDSYEGGGGRDPGCHCFARSAAPGMRRPLAAQRLATFCGRHV